MLRHARACFTRVRVPGSALRRLTGAAVVGGAGAVALGASPATCESSRHWYGDPFSWDSPLSSFLFEPFGLAQHDRARLFALDRPGVQVTEAADGYEFSVALPGVRPADLDVSVEGGVLLLKGTARHGSFERRLRFPRDADGSASSATFEDGLLSLTVRRRALPLALSLSLALNPQPQPQPQPQPHPHPHLPPRQAVLAAIPPYVDASGRIVAHVTSSFRARCLEDKREA